jgi:class 3 adenylate cyclase/tetratricopeptide (TPR) repeat protein
MAPELRELLAPYVSGLQLRRLAERGAGAEAPTEEALSGALLFLDVVGFTSLTERLGGVGPEGAEQLGQILEAYFGTVVDVLTDRGGDVLFFAGDAILTLWPAANRGEEGLEDACLGAANAALTIQRQVRALEPPLGISLEFRASLAAGALTIRDLGGADGRWLQLVSGLPLADVREVDAHSSPGAVFCASSFIDRLEGSSPEAEIVAPGYARLRGLAASPDESATAADTGLSSGEGWTGRSEPPRGVGSAGVLWRLPGAGDAGVLSRLVGAVPKVVHERLTAGHGEFLAEFRRITMLFIRLSGEDRTPPGLESLHEVVRAIQKTVSRFDGTVYQLLEDDKGIAALAAFGLPGVSHADDAARAVRAAQIVVAELMGLGLRPSLGVATGRLFCGVLGSRSRKNYSLLGSTMNLGSRLMQAAGDGEVLCDEPTTQAAGRQLGFARRDDVSLKGFADPQPTYAPHAGPDIGAPERPPGRVGGDRGGLVGRQPELELLDSRLKALRAGEAPGVVVIEAEAGVGKSTLVDAFIARARGRGVRCSRGEADALDTGTPYYVFRQVARDWFGIPPGATTEDAAEALRRSLAAISEFVPLAPLLNGILELDLPETALTAQMRGAIRAENLRNIVVHFAQAHSDAAPGAICLEDGHWMDSASWGLLEDIRLAIPGMCLVLTTRPLDEGPEELEAIRTDETTTHIRLKPLSGQEAAELVRYEFDCEDVSPEVVESIESRAEGNPLFIEELVRSLRDSGHLSVRDGCCVWSRSIDEEAGEFPSTLEGVFTARVDRLGPDAQLTLKIASVIGRSFDTGLLERVHPLQRDGGFGIHLVDLCDARLIESDAGEAPGGYRFRHALGRDAVYGLLPFARRTELHRLVAEGLEDIHAENIGPVQARLAHHYRLGRLPDRAIPHLAGAGDQALDNHANREAIRFFSQALEVDEEVRGDLDRDVLRARWHRKTGDAWYSLNDHARARGAYLRALSYVSRIDPWRLGTQLSVLPRLWFEPWRAALRGKEQTGARREESLETIRALRELCVVLLWQGEHGKWAVTAATAAGLAPRVGTCGEAAEAIAQIGALYTPTGLRRAADRRTLQAATMAAEVGDLEMIVSTHVIRAMVLTSLGRHQEALEPASRAQTAADKLRGGLFQHRSRFASAEPLFWLARYRESEEQFLLCAESAREAEPHVAGLTNCLAALARLRRGEIDAVVELMEGPDGLALIRETPVVHSMICALGALAEARLAAGDWEGIWSAALEAERVITPQDDATVSFSSAMIGHGGIAEALLSAVQRPYEQGPHDGSLPGSASTGGDVDREALLRRFLGRTRAVARHHRGCSARWHLVAGLDAMRRGRKRAARSRLQRAVRVGTRYGTPYEVARSHPALAELDVE